MGEFAGKVVLISGAARGQGRAHALRFAEEGASLVLFDICAQIPGVPFPLATTEDLADTVQLATSAGAKVTSGIADVRSFQQVSAITHQGLETFGHIDVVVANAGIVNSFAGGSSPHAQAEVGFYCAIASQAGSYPQADGRLAHYSASRATAISFTRSLAAELGPDGIRVNAVAPGATLTPRVAALAAARNMVTAESARHVAPRRLGQADDIAKVVHFLDSDPAGWVTGQCIAANGGQIPLGSS
jgi:NAD(P)-dependent dehydrogenase (short-subunit alcohol dehydrogenase family)